MLARGLRGLPKCACFRSRFDVPASAGFTLSLKVTTHAVASAGCGLALRVEGLRAAGRVEIHASTAVSSHALALGVIKTPAGKSWVSIKRLSVMRLLTMPLATRSGYLIHFMLCYPC